MQGIVYIFAGSYVSTPGQYVDSLQNSAGCDSIVYFNLTVESTIVTQDTIDICAGDSVFVGGGLSIYNRTI